MGITRGWRSAWAGAATAVGVLTVLVLALGPAITSLPLKTLRLIVGGLLLTFGLQWLRKAILRAGGLKPLNQQDARFARKSEAARAAGERGAERLDGYGFTVSFKGVLLEGLEVVFIVLTFGANQHNVSLAAWAAAGAVMVVTGFAVGVRRPLSRLPENTMKFAVGVMLTSFGCFWGAEGAGVVWPGDEAALPGVVGFVLACAVLAVAALRRAARTPDRAVIA
jgi:uncharacterized membrane protein